MINALNLGASLFIPASNKNLCDILEGKKYPFLKSIVIDFEDGYDGDNQKEILQNIEKLKKKSLITLIRFSTPYELNHALKKFDLSKIDGFVLPKFSLKNANKYIKIIKDPSFTHFISIAIEEEELFNENKLRELKSYIDQVRLKVVNIRFGAEDMFRQLGLRRECDKTLFDYSVASSVIATMIKVFKLDGYSISGAVFRCFKDDKNFIKDVQRDIREGLLSKSVIHPQQVLLFDQIYKVSEEDYADAQAVLQAHTKVLNLHNTMLEKLTQSSWAQGIIEREKIYGLSNYHT